MRRLLLFIILFMAVHLRAQTVTGMVKDGADKPLPGVSVVLKNGRGRIRAYAITSKQGVFSLKLPGAVGRSDTLEFRNMGYATVAVVLKAFRNGQAVTMRETAFALKEVKVKPQKIYLRGDTVDYLVGSFRQKNDRSIADVIARMPGLEVGGDGSITYQGKSISKFYIEGMDLMGGKYATASENIDAGKVKKVQVMENHQPVRALKDVAFSDQAALNIVLEDDVRDLWQGELTLSGGATLQGKTDALYDSRALAMLFSRKLQSVSMYKCNNTGKDISREVRPLSSLDGYVPTEGGLLSGISVGGTGLKEDRTMFNDTHVLATNWLLRTPGGNDLRLQLTGLFDKSLHRQHTQTVYTDIGLGAAVTEDADARSYSNEYDGELMYKVNKDNLYLVNTLKGYACFDRSVGLTVLNGGETRRMVRPRKRYVTDDLRFIKNMSGGRGFAFSSAFAYSFLPGTLLLADGTRETLDISTLNWNARTSFRHRLAFLNVDYAAGFELKRQTVGVTNTFNTATDRYDDCRVFLTPSAGYSGSVLNFDVRVPFSWRYRRLNGRHKVFLTAEPGLFVRYEPTARWQLYASYMCSWNPYDALSSGAASVFTDYITMRRGSGSLENTTSHIVSLSARYRDVIRGFFADAGASYGSLRGMPMYRGELRGNVYCSTPSGYDTDAASVSVHGDAGKSFDWAGLLLKFSFRKSWRDYDMLADDVPVLCRMETGELRLSVSVKPAFWLAADVSSSFNHSRQVSKNGGGGGGMTLRYFNHVIKVYVMPGKWLLEWDGELYHSNDGTVSSSFFSDLSVSYKTKTMEVGLTCGNIFGRQAFERRYVTDLQRIYTVSRLRPREMLLKLRIGF